MRKKAHPTKRRKRTRLQKAELKLADTTHSANRIIKAQARLLAVALLGFVLSAALNIVQLVWGG